MNIEEEIRFGKILGTKEMFSFQVEFPKGKEANILLSSGDEFIAELKMPRTEAVKMLHKLKKADLLAEAGV